MTEKEELFEEIHTIFTEMREGDDVISQDNHIPVYAIDLNPGDFIDVAGVEYFIAQKFETKKYIMVELSIFGTSLDSGRSVFLTFFKYHLVNVRRNQ